MRALAFLCPKCNNESLNIRERIELPGDDRSDEISLQIIGCSKCRFAGLAVYEESRRGSLDSESWSHRGYGADLNYIREIRGLISKCPSPKSAKCKCESHNILGKRKGWRWAGPDYEKLGDAFPIEKKNVIP